MSEPYWYTCEVPPGLKLAMWLCCHYYCQQGCEVKTKLMCCETIGKICLQQDDGLIPINVALGVALWEDVGSAALCKMHIQMEGKRGPELLGGTVCLC